MTKNDARVAKLRTEVESRHAALKGRSSRFVPVTNCSLELDGVRYNLNVLDTDQLFYVAAKLQALVLGAESLWMKSDNVVIGGYKVADWLTDVKARIETVAVKLEESKLRQLDAKLRDLLSEDARTDLALNDIESLLA